MKNTCMAYSVVHKRYIYHALTPFIHFIFFHLLKQLAIDWYGFHNNLLQWHCLYNISSAYFYMNITFFCDVHKRLFIVRKRFSIDQYRFHYDFRLWHCLRKVSNANMYVFYAAKLPRKKIGKHKSKIVNVALLTS